jgi:hypothetical protein
MAPPKRPWFRFYVEALTDPKLRRLSAEERWLWVVVLGLARQSPVPGWLLVTESIPMEPDDMSEMAGVTAAKVGKGLAKMVDLGLLIHDRSGAYRVTKWDERQFESDDVAKRTAKHRSKNNEATSMERPNAVDVTPPETDDRDREQSSETDPVTTDDDYESSTDMESSSWTDDDLFIEAGRTAARCHAGTFRNGFDAFATGAANKIRRERGYLVPKLRERGYPLAQAASIISQRDAEDFLSTPWIDLPINSDCMQEQGT